jgi:Fur family ferric uptake transcriptional regulator
MDVDLDLSSLLRERGHRVTPPRRLVWSVLQSADAHLTAEAIAARVSEMDPSVNLSSIYRSLALFADLDLVRESSFDSDGASRWEIAHPDDHFHLVCRNCGRVEHHVGDQVEQIRRHLGSGHGFKVESVDLLVSGLCADCSQLGG